MTGRPGIRVSFVVTAAVMGALVALGLAKKYDDGQIAWAIMTLAIIAILLVGALALSPGERPMRDGIVSGAVVGLIVGGQQAYGMGRTLDSPAEAGLAVAAFLVVFVPCVVAGASAGAVGEWRKKAASKP